MPWDDDDDDDNDDDDDDDDDDDEETSLQHCHAHISVFFHSGICIPPPNHYTVYRRRL